MVKKQFIVYGLWFIVFMLSRNAFAQEVTFKATVDKDRVTLNDKIELTLTVTGAQDAGEPELPELDGLDVVSSGSSSQFSFINGQMSVSKNFTYILMPLKEGRLTIPPASITAGGKTLKTEPIDVEVVKGGQRAVAAGPASTEKTGIKERIFIEVTTDKQSAYTGEQIAMTFRLYRRGVMIDNLQYTPPGTKGFVTESMGPQREYRDTVNGVVYDIVELKTAIFPATEGDLTIDPARLKCDLLVREQRQRRIRGGFFDDFFDDPFFSSYVRYPIDLESEPVRIAVKPLPPENRSLSFKGAVGAYDLAVEASPQSLKAGEPINLVMKVSGSGNVTQVQEPVLKDLTGFKAYESEIRTEITGRDPRIAGSKVFQKIIIPQDETVHEIPLIEFSYFDPLTNQYHKIKKGPFPVTVAPAPKKDTGIVELIKEIAPEEEAKKQIKLLAKDIHFIKTSPGRFTRIERYWYMNIWLWVTIFAGPLLVLTTLTVYKGHKARMETDSAYAKARGAHKIARKLLQEAIGYQKENKPKEFYDACAKAIQKFISDKLNIPIGALSLDLLTQKDIDTTPIKNLLAASDMVRFGAHTATQQEMKEVIKEAERIIGILNKKL